MTTNNSWKQSLDREGLVNLMKKYLAALIENDPSAVLFDKYVKFTQNCAEIPVGYGLWDTASSGPTDFQIYAADPVNQQVACLVMMKENENENILLGARLALKLGKIAEAEHHVITQDMLHAMHNMEKPRSTFVEDIAPEDRTPRQDMLDIGLSYYDALADNDGTLAPFTEDCQRRENGGISVGGTEEDTKNSEAKRDFAPPESENPEMKKLAEALSAVPNTCEGQMTAGVWGYISEIRNRRLLVIDEQKGLAVGFSNLHHDSKLKEMKIKGVPGIDSVPAFQGTFNMPSIHFFKIKKGKISDIEATGISVPYGTKTGWE